MVTKYRFLENLIFLKGNKEVETQINDYIEELRVELKQLQKLGHNAVKIESKLNVNLTRLEQSLVDDMLRREINGK